MARPGPSWSFLSQFLATPCIQSSVARVYLFVYHDAIAVVAPAVARIARSCYEYPLARIDFGTKRFLILGPSPTQRGVGGGVPWRGTRPFPPTFALIINHWTYPDMRLESEIMLQATSHRAKRNDKSYRKQASAVGRGQRAKGSGLKTLLKFLHDI